MSIKPTSQKHVQHRIALGPADPGRRWPFHVERDAEWRVENDFAIAEVMLPDLPSDHMIVPSYSSVSNEGYRFSVYTEDLDAHSAGFGQSGLQDLRPVPNAAIKVPVDYFETACAVNGAVVRVTLNTRDVPQDYLFVVSVRPKWLGGDTPAAASTAVLDVEPISQMRAAADIRNRICAPTCLAMALRHFGIEHVQQELLRAAFHRGADLYGVWPQNLWAASRWGVLGAVDAHSRWDVLLRSAASVGALMTTSIAFEQDGLPGSPLRRTEGHIVMLLGLAGDQVIVNDPAAATDCEVRRHYPVESFHQAWLNGSGASFVFIPPDRAQ